MYGVLRMREAHGHIDMPMWSEFFREHFPLDFFFSIIDSLISFSLTRPFNRLSHINGRECRFECIAGHNRDYMLCGSHSIYDFVHRAPAFRGITTLIQTFYKLR